MFVCYARFSGFQFLMNECCCDFHRLSFWWFVLFFHCLVFLKHIFFSFFYFLSPLIIFKTHVYTHLTIFVVRNLFLREFWLHASPLPPPPILLFKCLEWCADFSPLHEETSLDDNQRLVYTFGRLEVVDIGYRHAIGCPSHLCLSCHALFSSIHTQFVVNYGRAIGRSSSFWKSYSLAEPLLVPPTTKL